MGERVEKKGGRGWQRERRREREEDGSCAYVRREIEGDGADARGGIPGDGGAAHGQPPW